jgi:hypothetical protein
MTRARTWQAILGVTALLATLALTSPGVRLARAGEGDSPAAVSIQDRASATSAPESGRIALPSEAPVCRPATAAAADFDANLAVMQLQQRLAAKAAAAAAAPSGNPSQSEGVALNNRGYNYRSAPGH